MEIEDGPPHIEAPRTIQELGNELIELARKKFPSSECCGDCMFREPYHEPANHDFREVVDPFILKVESFVARVLSEQKE